MHTSNMRHAPVRISAASLVAVSLAVGVLAPRTSASQLAIPRAATVTLVGHGYGAGIGLSQWGAFGYAVKYHFGYERILNRYYGRTSSTTLPSIGRSSNPTMRVVVLENLNQTTNLGYDPVVTSSSAFTVTSGGTGTSGMSGVSEATTTVPTSSTTTTVSTSTTVAGSSGATTTTLPPATLPPTTSAIAVPGGTAIDFRLQTNGTWSAYEAASCSAARAVAVTTPVAIGLVNPVVTPSSLDPAAPRTSQLTLCRNDGVDEPLRGQIEAYDRSGYARTLNLVPLESYLQGVVPAESSASWGSVGALPGAPQGEPWGFQALEAQAVAARSYALAYSAAGGWNGYADICDTAQCQAYVGSTYETTLSNASVAATANEVRVAPGALFGSASVVSTRFSASSGGFTAPGTFPAVRDLGDACVLPGAPLQCNPNHTWTVTVPATVINKAFPTIGRLLRVRITQRNHYGQLGGRAISVNLTGTKAALVVSGNTFAAAANLKSNWFAVSKVARVGAPVETPTTVPTAVTGPTGATGVTGSTGATGATGSAGSGAIAGTGG
ncbi:MAG TPA: SpoIID/LytB domain-containing protein [Acidimicrobiales bacterium]|nr:SpoIID/LytB domain-containing protein [Acidimicrobiales bacterium]